jgi:hypothetical protein
MLARFITNGIYDSSMGFRQFLVFNMERFLKIFWFGLLARMMAARIKLEFGGFTL